MIEMITLLGADGELKSVPMKCTAALPRLYKMLFHEDFFERLQVFYSGAQKEGAAGEIAALTQQKNRLVEETSALILEREQVLQTLAALEEGGAAKTAITAKKKKEETLTKTIKEKTGEAETCAKAIEQLSLSVLLEGNLLQNFDFVENLAYIFALEADRDIPRDIVLWLGQFDSSAIYAASGEIMGLYNKSSDPSSETKKKHAL